MFAPAWSTVATFLEFKLHFTELRVITTVLVTKSHAADSDSASTSYREAVNRSVATDDKLVLAHGILLTDLARRVRKCLFCSAGNILVARDRVPSFVSGDLGSTLALPCYTPLFRGVCRLDLLLL